MTTQGYPYEGIEYIKPPHQLEVDTDRGVLYMHDLTAGQTVLRVCRIADHILVGFYNELGTVQLPLRSVIPRIRGVEERKGVLKKEPTFINLPDHWDSNNGLFTIETEAGAVMFEFYNVPDRVMKSLLAGEFTDITIGVTGR